MEQLLETKNPQSDKNNSHIRSRLDPMCLLPDENDIIDLSKLHLSDDENWLCETSKRSQTTDLETWLYSDTNSKNIDTRTFTRPKKQRFAARPSIEKYKEECYGNEIEMGMQVKGSDLVPEKEKPLHFDLAQPLSNSYYFDNIVANAPVADPFQNMSPPSLVNSMCSSTFANLMENSFIKNDPVLREIRDTDYTGLVLQQQEAEPMCQSITESWSSISSDHLAAESFFLRKIPFNEHADTTFAKENTPSRETIILDDHDDGTLKNVVNSTFIQKFNGTYQKSVNSTFQRRRKSASQNDEINVTKLPPSLEMTKRLLNRRPSPSMDLNRLSYQREKSTDRLNQTYPNNDNTKRNSIESSGDSTENLDYMSLSSGSSSKISSTDGIIGDVSEGNLHQIMSTPKPRPSAQSLFQGDDISPISGRNSSDPELSSIEKAAHPDVVMRLNTIKKQKSTGNIVSQIKGGGSQPNLRRVLPPPKTSNLHSMGYTLKGSYTSLTPINRNLPVAPPLDRTVTLPKKATAQVAPVIRDNNNAQAMKSGLPRPVTGIPRPVSRIPGPRTIRPVTKSANQPGRPSNRYY